MEEPHPSCGSTALPAPMQTPRSRGTMSHPCHGQEHVPKIGDSLYLCCRCFFCLLLDFVVAWHLKTSVKITFDAVFAYSRQILLLAFSQGLPVGIYAYAGPHGRCCLARHSKLGLSSLANENFRFPKFISSAEYSSVEWFQATKRESNIILRGMERWALKQNQG